MSAPFCSAVLLAGGRSTRMQRDKALLPVPGCDLLLWQRQLRTLEELRPEEIFWSGPERPGLPDHVRVVSDTVENAGPLAGLSVGLKFCASDLLVALAIDLPRMNASFLNKLVTQCRPGCGVVCRQGDYFEPLAAIYPRELSGLATNHLAQGRLALQEFVREAVQGKLLSVVSLAEEDASHFKNLNSPDDLQDGF